jgi:hypothetical protein
MYAMGQNSFRQQVRTDNNTRTICKWNGLHGDVKSKKLRKSLHIAGFCLTLLPDKTKAKQQ